MHVALASNTLPANSILPCSPEPPSGAVFHSLPYRVEGVGGPLVIRQRRGLSAFEARFQLDSSSLLGSRKGKGLFVCFVLFEVCVCVCVCQYLGVKFIHVKLPLFSCTLLLA